MQTIGLNKMADSIPRASSLQAMQSLLGSYNDHDDDGDENEEESMDDKIHDINNISGSDDEVDHHDKNQITSPESVKRQTDNDSKHSTPVKVPKLEKRITKLVSYTGHEEEDEEDDDNDDSESEHLGVVNLVDYTLNESHMTSNSLSRSFVSVPGDDIQLPPTPTGNCSRSLQDKVSKMYEKMKHGSGLDLNASIQRKKEFRNPSIYDKLIEFCGIDEKGTNYPPDLYNPLIWGKDSYFDALAKTQKEEMDKREKERKDRTKVEFVVATKKSSSSTDLASKGKEVKKEIKQERKSKWDSSSTSVATSSSSGKSTTVISAVGTLKKPK